MGFDEIRGRIKTANAEGAKDAKERKGKQATAL
jgi:hypothetical protein